MFAVANGTDDLQPHRCRQQAEEFGGRFEYLIFLVEVGHGISRGCCGASTVAAHADTGTIQLDECHEASKSGHPESAYRPLGGVANGIS